MEKKDTKRKIALVLGGGSARGLAHVGVLKVFKKYGIPFDLVVGTSIGSFMGAVYALDLPLDRIEMLAHDLSWKRLADFVISKSGFLEGRNMERMIREYLDNKTFEDLKVPLAIAATDIEMGEEVVMTSGDLCRCIKASCSIPGIFMPTEIDGRLLVDGGLKSSVPSEVARRLGADFIVAVDVGFCIKRGKITNMFQIIYQSIQILGNELNKFQSKQADFTLRIHMDDDIDQMAFDKAAYIMSAGEKAANDAVGSIISALRTEGLI